MERGIDSRALAIRFRRGGMQRRVGYPGIAGLRGPCLTHANLPSCCLSDAHGRRSAQCHRPHHVVDQGIPQHDRSDFEPTPHAELLQPAVAGQGVDALDCRGTLLV